MTQAGQMTLRETVARAIEPSIVFDGFGNDRMEVARSVSQAALAALAVAGYVIVPKDLLADVLETARGNSWTAESELSCSAAEDREYAAERAKIDEVFACFTAVLAEAEGK